jgi:hypothetical protein
MNERAWNDMLAEFRALGGVADNICLREGPYGRSVFPLDPAKPVLLHAPDNLLLDVADVMFVSGAFRVGPNSQMGTREKAFIENYENTCSWGGGGRAEIERIFSQAQDLPLELSEGLRAEKYYFGSWFDDVDDALIQDRFLKTRHIEHRGHNVVMPVIELLNHSPAVESFDTTSGVALRGTFSGEVLVRYSDADAYGVFGAWGFASDQRQAFSIGIKTTTSNLATTISRDLKGVSSTEALVIPKSMKTDDGIAFQYLMIGSKKYPRLCKGIFYKLMRDAEITGFEEAFDKIQFGNMKHASDLLELLEKGDGPMVATLRRVVCYQLRAMAHCFGVRAI